MVNQNQQPVGDSNEHEKRLRASLKSSALAKILRPASIKLSKNSRLSQS